MVEMSEDFVAKQDLAQFLDTGNSTCRYRRSGYVTLSSTLRWGVAIQS